MVKIELFDFQEEASLKLIEITSNKESKQTVLMKALLLVVRQLY